MTCCRQGVAGGLYPSDSSYEDGTPLPWPLSLRHVAFVREHGVRQFLNTYARVKDATSPLLWGDEVRAAPLTLLRW